MQFSKFIKYTFLLWYSSKYIYDIRIKMNKKARILFIYPSLLSYKDRSLFGFKCGSCLIIPVPGGYCLNTSAKL